MRRRADRYSVELPVELVTPERRRVVSVQDLSRTGMFLQLAQPLPNGTRVQIAMTVEGQRRVTAATVTHALADADARLLGREPGIGIAFRESIGLTDELFALAVDRLIREVRTAPRSRGHIVVADPETRLLERLSSALGEAGFTVTTATTGIELLAACLRRRPDAILCDRAMPLADGMNVLDQLAHEPMLAAVPTIVTSPDRGDVAVAFEHGAADFLAKPFTTVELLARTRRLVDRYPPPHDPVILRGSLAGLALPALLTMFEQERTSGRLAIAGADAAWIDLLDGRIVGAGSGTGADPHTAVMMAISWTEGTFEFVPCVPSRTAPLLPITHLLIDHACRIDERNELARREAAC